MPPRRKDHTDYSQLFSAIDIMDLEVHPGGGVAICSVNRGINWNLAQLDLRTGRLTDVLSGGKANSLMHPSYSPSGDRLTYQMDFEGSENHDVYAADVGGGRLKKLTDSVEDNFEPQFSPDGESIAFLSNRQDDIENIYVMNSRGGTIRKLSKEPLPVKEFYWSSDNRTIVYASGIGDDDYISVLDVQRAKAKKVLTEKNVEHSLSGEYGDACPWSEDGKSFLYRSNENDVFDIAQFDLATSKRRWIVRSKYDKYQPQWSPDGSSLAYLEVADPSIVLKVKKEKLQTTTFPKDGVTRVVRWLPNGGLVFINGSSTRPDEVYVAKGSRPRKVTRLLSKPIDKNILPQPKLIKFRSFDGRRIPAQLVIPRVRSRKAGIVMPHGGPDAQDVDVWDQLALMLADRGFVVIKPNYRGSTGYGREFNHLHDKDMGGGDFMDTVYAGKYLLESGMVKKDRLGYWGASYSGFTCMLALTKTPEMWAAAVSIVGFFDWETEMTTERGYLKAYDEKKMGRFDENPEFFRERSPIYFLENIRAPLLMTASSRDVRCPPTQSRAVVQKLKKLGKMVVYHEYPDEGHWPRKRKNLKDLYERSTKFLDKNIPG